MKRIFLGLTLAMMLPACGVTPNLTAKTYQATQYNPRIVHDIALDRKVLDNGKLHAIVKPEVLAMNIQYAPVLNLRDQVNKALGLRLNFLRNWENTGEAHITVITPPEYKGVLSKRLSMKRIAAIASEEKIQESDLTIKGLGCGQKELHGTTEQTFFIIVESANLLKIRTRIYEEYLKAGGAKDAWNPDAYYPHITVGFTKRDLHEGDGVIKDITHSMDKRFNLTF